MPPTEAQIRRAALIATSEATGIPVEKLARAILLYTAVVAEERRANSNTADHPGQRHRGCLPPA
jgi:hypothetical protein